MTQKHPKIVGELFHNTLRANIYDLAKETPLEIMANLTNRTDNTILLKREDLQPVFTFKVRGAYNMIRQLPSEQLKRGIITASAGNHAQGVAISAQKLGVAATIVMPNTTPNTKVDKVCALGAQEILHGDSYDDAYKRACELIDKNNLSYIPPFDHPEVMAGQGTVAMEMLHQYSGQLDAVFVPVGGGGLLAGVASYIKMLQPQIKVFAVEPEDSDCLAKAMEKGRRVKLSNVGLFADGVAVKQIGKHTFPAIKTTIDGCIRVSTDEICAAVKDIFDDHRVVSEPAGALSLAGLKKFIDTNEVKGLTLAAINSGANTNFERLGHIVERAQLGEKQEAVFAVTIPEKAGSFLKFCQALKGKDRHISEFNYRYADNGDAHIFVGIKLKKDKETSQDVADMLRGKGYKVEDMTNNELAIIHVRHMVGGRPPESLEQQNNEMLYRCVFPERPYALLDFLIKLREAGSWNISLFHYRNHGAAYGRALVGLQVPENEIAIFHRFIQDSDYDFTPENTNPAYKLFLRK